MSCPNEECPQPYAWPVIDKLGRWSCQFCMARRDVDESRAHLLAWIGKERKFWADAKYPDKDLHNLKMADTGIEWWMDFMPNYMSRAEVLGLDTPQGRQALGKLITTAMDCLETACRVYGPMPLPGYTSGEIHLADVQTSPPTRE